MSETKVSAGLYLVHDQKLDRIKQPSLNRKNDPTRKCELDHNVKLICFIMRHYEANEMPRPCCKSKRTL